MVRAVRLGLTAVVTLGALALSAGPAHSAVSNAAAKARCTIVGTAGDDVLIGSSRDDVLCGLGGDDELWGLGGDDVLRGGAGHDTMRGGTGHNTLVRDRADFVVEVLARSNYTGVPAGSLVIFQGPRSVPSTCLTETGSTTTMSLPAIASAALIPLATWYSRCAVTADWNVKVVLPNGLIHETTMSVSFSPKGTMSATCSNPEFVCAADGAKASAAGVVFDLRIGAGSAWGE